MEFYLSTPLLFLKFWYISAPLRLIRYFFSLNHAAAQVLSLPLMIKTFFKPLKNEYRKGLVVFSIGMGIVVKTGFIIADLIIFLSVIVLEIILIILFLLWPIGTVYVLLI